jgi:hypothetical protein
LNATHVAPHHGRARITIQLGQPLENMKKGPAISHRPLKSILGEDRHIGSIIVHRSREYCNAQNAALQKIHFAVTAARSSLVPFARSVL